nr:hypothetical protein [Providencia sp. PROV145]
MNDSAIEKPALARVNVNIIFPAFIGSNTLNIIKLKPFQKIKPKPQTIETLDSKGQSSLNIFFKLKPMTIRLNDLSKLRKGDSNSKYRTILDISNPKNILYKPKFKYNETQITIGFMVEDIACALYSSNCFWAPSRKSCIGVNRLMNAVVKTKHHQGKNQSISPVYEL